MTTRRKAWNSTLNAPSKPIGRTSQLRKVGKQRPKREARYRAFMASAAWKAIRWATFLLDKFTCAICGWRDVTETGSGLVCDHTSYARFGGDEIVGEDTRTLCKECNRIATTSQRANWFQPRRKV